MVSFRLLNFLIGITVAVLIGGSLNTYAAEDINIGTERGILSEGLGFENPPSRQTLDVSSERGMFSIGVGYEVSQSRLANTDSNYASYLGGGYRVEIDLSFTPPGPGEIRLFGASTNLDLSGEQRATDDLVLRANSLGLKFFSNQRLYLGVSYGNMSQKITAAGTEVSTSNPFISAGLGYEFKVDGNFYANFSGWYNQSVIEKTNQLDSSSSLDGINLYLGLVWAPPAVTILHSVK